MASGRKLKGVVLLLAGLASGAGATYLVWDQMTNPLRHSVALVAALVLAAGLCSALGAGALRGKDGPPTLGAPDFRHIVPLFAVLVGLVLLAGIGLEAAIPPTFGQYGGFRGGAEVDARKREPRHLGEAACVKCHQKQVGLHDKDAHAAVACETCHGPGKVHAAFRSSETAASAEVPNEARMRIRKGRDWCLTCHRKEPARPGAFPQIDVAQHFQTVGVKDQATECTACHDPHEPLFMDRDLRQARMHPLVHRCRDCHNATMQETATVPAKHPATFQCSYCHADVAKRTQKVPHKNVACRTCHLFFKQSEFAGRIIRDTDPRFCLLCHRAAPFRTEGKPPKIVWPDHRSEMGDGPDDKRKCIDCHRAQIHWPEEGDSP